MDRRDFVLFRTRGRLRVADLSCERLYMRSVDARVTAEDAAAGFDPTDGGEPPTEIEPVTSRQVFASLERDLGHVDVVRLTGGEWVEALDAEWRDGLEGLLAWVRRRGAEVELADSASAEGPDDPDAAGKR